MKLVFISDTHNRHKNLLIPECDILISCGDFTSMGYEDEVRKFSKWMDQQDARHIIIVPGNHELYFEKGLPESLNWIKDECPIANVLMNDSIEIEGIKFHGLSWTPFFFDWAFNAGRTIVEAGFYRKPFMGDLVEKIPDDVNILISHGPPHGILDTVNYADGTPKSGNLGCWELLKRVTELKDLDIHAFGHIHSSAGEKHQDGVSFYNASICDEIYMPSNPITEVEYEIS